MDAVLRELSDQIDQATQRLLDAARVLTDPDVRAPSLLAVWTRAHVLTHVAQNADGMRNVLAGVRTGQDSPAYASGRARARPPGNSRPTWPTPRWRCAPWPGSCPTRGGRFRCACWTRVPSFPPP